MDVSNVSQTNPTTDVNNIPQTNTSSEVSEQPSFTESGEAIVYETMPVVEQEKKQEVEKTVEIETPAIEQQPVTETPTPTPTPTIPTITEQITTLNVVDKRTNDVVEHDVVTKDKLSQLADEDENGFIEQVETAHNAKP